MTPYEDEPRYGDEPALLDGRPKRGHPIIAWAVIVAVSVGVVFLQLYRSAPEKQARKQGKPSGPGGGQFTAKVQVGMAEIIPESRRDSANSLNTQLREETERYS